MKIIKSESRMDKPVMLRLTKTDRKRLEVLAKRARVPISKIAYDALRHLLDQEFAKEAQQ